MVLFDVALGGIVFDVVIESRYSFEMRSRFRYYHDKVRREEVGVSMYPLRDKDLGEMSPLLRSLIDAYRPHTTPDWGNLTPLPVRESFIEELSEAA